MTCQISHSASRVPNCSPSTALIMLPSPPRILGIVLPDNASYTVPSVVDASPAISWRPRLDPKETNAGDIDPPSKSTFTERLDTYETHDMTPPEHTILPLFTTTTPPMGCWEASLMPCASLSQTVETFWKTTSLGTIPRGSRGGNPSYLMVFFVS